MSQRRVSDIVANADTGRNACVTRVTKDGDPGLERSRERVAQCGGWSVSAAGQRSERCGLGWLAMDGVVPRNSPTDEEKVS